MAKLRIILFLIILFHSSIALAAIAVNAAGGNFSSGATWAGGISPTSADDCDVTPLTGTLTIDGTTGSPNECKNFTTGAAGTITHASAKFLQVYGDLVLTAGVTYNPSASSTLKMKATTTGKQITTAGHTMGQFYLDGVSGEWTLQDNYTGTNVISNSNKGISLVNGSFIDNGKTVLSNFESNNSNTRAFTCTGDWTVSNQAGINWDIRTITGLTATTSNCDVTVNNSGSSSNITFAGGGLSYGTVSITANTVTHTISGQDNVFDTLTVSGNATADNAIILADDFTVTNTCTFNGSGTDTDRLFLKTDTNTNNVLHQVTFECGTVSMQNVDLQDLAWGGGSPLDLSAITGKSGDAGGNDNITTTTPICAYWFLNGNANWSTNNWYDVSGGGVGHSVRQPLPQDVAIFDLLSATTGSRTVTISAAVGNYHRIANINATGQSVVNGVTCFPGGAPGGNLTLTFGQNSYFGSILIPSSSSLTITNSGGLNPMTLEGRSADNEFQLSGQTWAPAMNLKYPGGTYTQLDDYTGSTTATGNAFNIFGGSIWDADGYNFTLSGASAQLTVQQSSQFINLLDLDITGATAAQLKILDTATVEADGVVTINGSGSTVTLTGGDFTAGQFDRTGRATTIAGTDVILGSGGMQGSTLTVSSGSLYEVDPAGDIALSGAWSQTGGLITIGQGGMTFASHSLTGGTLVTTGPAELAPTYLTVGANTYSGYSRGRVVNH